jgi:hypothetical protein
MKLKNYFKKNKDVPEIIFIFALPNHAEVAQLVEHNLAKVGVAGPNPVFCSKTNQTLIQSRVFFRSYNAPWWWNW